MNSDKANIFKFAFGGREILTVVQAGVVKFKVKYSESEPEYAKTAHLAAAGVVRDGLNGRAE